MNIECCEMAAIASHDRAFGQRCAQQMTSSRASVICKCVSAKHPLPSLPPFEQAKQALFGVENLFAASRNSDKFQGKHAARVCDQGSSK